MKVQRSKFVGSVLDEVLREQRDTGLGKIDISHKNRETV